MSATLSFWIFLGGLAALVVAGLGIRSLRTFSRHDLEEICRRRGRPERFSQVLRWHESVALGIEMLAVLATSVTVVGGYLWAIQRWHFAADSWLIVLAVAISLGLLLTVATTWVAWAVARLFSEEFLYSTWPLWKRLAFFAAPLVWGARLVDITLHRLFGRSQELFDEETIEEEIRTIVTEGHREGLLEEEAREMIEGVIELGDADVSEIMTPRTDMHMLQVDLPWEQIISDAIEAGHTRIPVYDKNRDDIVGVLYTKDLLPELATSDPESRASLRGLLRKPVFVPETMPLDDLLQMFQKMRTHIAVVLDEYGGVSGLVTIEDVLEEIVGEIVDEYDEELEAEIEQIDEDTCVALGRTHVDEINEALNIELPDDGDFDTIGGFVFSELGRVPQPGESLVWQDKVQIQVLEATKRRIDRVRVERLPNRQLESV
jgi:CBS domain containing-hemolysin-like protein